MVNNLMEDNMSTRAMYTFTDAGGDFHVYKHHDGYPYYSHAQSGHGGLVWINNAKELAWDLPRFEAHEFAAAFVAANKKDSGGVELVNTVDPWENNSDCLYWYKVKIAVPALDVWVSVYEVNWFDQDNLKDENHRHGHAFQLIMEGALSELLASERARKEVA
jgi:hypothetical protein|tara:strand:- start:189 stop:674 length:486 start_codon:yes stop_codon:yes gene_type:complete